MAYCLEKHAFGKLETQLSEVSNPENERYGDSVQLLSMENTTGENRHRQPFQLV